MQALKSARFCFDQSGLEWIFGKFLNHTQAFFTKKPRKSGQKPGFENQKRAEETEGIFSKRHFFGIFCPFLGDLRKFVRTKV